MTEEEIKAILESLAKYSEKYGTSLTDLVKATGGFKKRIDELNKGIEKGTKGFKDQMRVIDELTDTIEEHTEALEKSTSQAEQDARKQHINKLIEERDALKQQALNQRVSESFEQFGEVVSKTATVGAGTFVKQLQSGASSTQLSAGILSGAIDMTASGVTALGHGMQAAGAGLATFVPHIFTKVVGGVIAGVGTVLAGTSETAAKALKFGNEILSAELEKTARAFDAISNIGAGFANGLTGMRDAASASRLTVDQFAKVLVENAQNISLAGLGYKDTLDKLSGVQSIFAKGTNSVRSQLLKLGYSFEEQASLTLETMSDMRRGGLLQGATNAQIAAQTKEYAENLRVISAITGEDAKKRMDQARTAMANTAIQAKILELQKNDPEAYKKLQAQLATMPVEMQKMYLQKISGLGVVDPVSAALMSQVPELEQALEANRSVLEDSAKDAKDAVDTAGEQRAILRKGLETNMDQLKILGMAQLAGLSGIGPDMSQMAAGIFEQVAGTTDETAKKARDSINAQKNAQDELTDGLIRGRDAAQGLAIQLQEILLPLLKDYSTYTAQVLDYLRKFINDVTGNTPWEERSTISKFGNIGSQMWDSLTSSKGWSIPPSSQLQSGPSMPGAPLGVFSMASGGIASGSVSGYSATLHGTEAVVPLPDNRSIPVSLDSSSLNSAISQNSALLAQILNAMQQNNKYTSGILQNSY